MSAAVIINALILWLKNKQNIEFIKKKKTKKKINVKRIRKKCFLPPIRVYCQTSRVVFAFRPLTSGQWRFVF